jgi:predicted O-methyltransferase YrrM
LSEADIVVRSLEDVKNYLIASGVEPPSKEAILWSVKKNPPLLDPQETDLLMKYVRTCKLHFVEIGTHRGGSSALISKYLPKGALLTTIDIFDKPPRNSLPPEGRPASRKLAEENIRKEGDITRSEIISGVSWKVGKGWKKPVDVLFIDGDHRYQAVKSDMNAWIPHIVKGGIIILHDINFKGIERALKELVANPGFSVQEVVGTLAVIRKLK